METTTNDLFAGFDVPEITTVKSEENQIDAMKQAYSDRVSFRDGLQQWINKNVRGSLPVVLPEKRFVFDRLTDKDKAEGKMATTLNQSNNETLWAMVLLAVGEQGYTTTALMGAVFKSTIEKMNPTAKVAIEDCKKACIPFLAWLTKNSVLQENITTMDDGRKQKNLIFADVFKDIVKGEVEEIRERGGIIMQPLHNKPADWTEGTFNSTHSELGINIVTKKGDTITDGLVSDSALAVMNKLQAVQFTAVGTDEDYYSILDNLDDPQAVEALKDWKGKNFYLTVTNDYRLRKYYRGGYISPQMEKAGRQFIAFANSEHVNRLDAISDLKAMIADINKPEEKIVYVSEVARLEALDTEKVWCNIPVYADGVANGVQHMSMITKSQKGADLTALTRGYVGKYIYNHCLDAILHLWKDATRKYIKICCMIMSYGATDRSVESRLVAWGCKDAQEVVATIHNEVPALRAYQKAVARRVKGKACVRLNRQDGSWFEFAKVDRNKATVYCGTFSARVSDSYVEDVNATERASIPNTIHGGDTLHLDKIIEQWEGNICTIHDAVGVVAGRKKELQPIILDTFNELHKKPLYDNMPFKFNGAPVVADNTKMFD